MNVGSTLIFTTSRDWKEIEARTTMSHFITIQHLRLGTEEQTTSWSLPLLYVETVRSDDQTIRLV